jgi:hypothetical protein
MLSAMLRHFDPSTNWMRAIFARMITAKTHMKA